MHFVKDSCGEVMEYPGSDVLEKLGSAFLEDPGSNVVNFLKDSDVLDKQCIVVLEEPESGVLEESKRLFLKGEEKGGDFLEEPGSVHLVMF